MKCDISGNENFSGMKIQQNITLSSWLIPTEDTLYGSRIELCSVNRMEAKIRDPKTSMSRRLGGLPLLWKRITFMFGKKR